MSNRIILMLVLIPVICFGQSIIPSDELPWGSYSSENGTSASYFRDGVLDTLHNIFGFNQWVSGFDLPSAIRWADTHHIYVNTGGYTTDEGNTWHIQPAQKYSLSTYYICHPEKGAINDCYRCQGFGDINPDYPEYWRYPCLESEHCVTLDTMILNWTLSLPNKHFWDGTQLAYYPRLKIGRNLSSDTLAPSTPLAFVYILRRRINPDTACCNLRIFDCCWDRIFLDTLKAAEVPYVLQDTIMFLHDVSGDSAFIVENYGVASTRDVVIGVYSLDACTLYVDYLELFDQYGRDLMSEFKLESVASAIKDSAGVNAWEGRLLGWQLKDTPFPQNYRPQAFIDSLIQVSMVEHGWNQHPVKGHAWFSGPPVYFREYMYQSRTKEPWVYIYPFDFPCRRVSAPDDKLIE